MSSRRAPQLPSVLDLCPHVRRPARRAAIQIGHLVAALTAAFPDAALLASDPSFADRIDTTPFDHVAADLIASARTLLRDIEALADPV
jgi:hypothetical protein